MLEGKRMKQMRSVQMEDTLGDLPLDDLLNYANAVAPRAHRAIALASGTPEQSALIAAIRREFPEVYDPGAEGGNADCP
jgi:hypothetical protein